jgi:uncharacterized protein YbjT (DUF2867 family)
VRVLILGATGSAGGCVLRMALAASDVETVRTITRRPLGITHPKLTEVIHDDYADYSRVAGAFAGVDACFYCLGKSVSQVSGEAEYRRITHDFALAAARMLHAQSPGTVFHFLSGAGADVNSSYMWARVKAETDRDLLTSFPALCWHPAAIDGMPSASEPLKYKVLRPVIRAFFGWSRRYYVTGDEIGRAMLHATRQGMRGRVVSNAEIRDMAAGAH